MIHRDVKMLVGRQPHAVEGSSGDATEASAHAYALLQERVGFGGAVPTLSHSDDDAVLYGKAETALAEPRREEFVGRGKAAAFMDRFGQ